MNSPAARLPSLESQEILTDEACVARILTGEKALYELLMRRHNARLFRIGRSILKDADEAEDLMQETYRKAYEKLRHFEGRSAFSSWLIRILINEGISRWRKKQVLIPTDLQENESRPSAFLHSGEKSPEDEMAGREIKRHIEAAVDALPEKYRVVYAMRELEGMSVAETAAGLELSSSNVKVRLLRAKAMLREQLREFYGDLEIYPFHLMRCDRVVESVLASVEAYAFDRTPETA
ncbi:MAG: RNA polymerase sigma factor [Spirochaetia bacterium]|nr:RNA polymerase sigma factor [Spirochaetia bacterium]